VKTEDIKETILRNSSEISRIHALLHETWRHRDEGTAASDAWKQAALEFRNRYNDLAFSGGYEGALDRLLTGEPLAIEAALCFLELRPYFFRSGYMFKDLLRKSRKAPLSTEQKLRLDAIEAAVSEWRKEKLPIKTASTNSQSSRTTANGKH
jgi:hypothetical protein